MIFHWIECIHIVHMHSRSLMIHWYMMVAKDSIMEEEGTSISYKYRVNEVSQKNSAGRIITGIKRIESS